MDLATLRERQGWTLEQKIDHAVGAVEQFKARTGRPLYVSFSGGKDSTVLLDLCRRFLDPEQKAVFNNTGNEYPEIIRFVRDKPNVTIISPRIPVRRIRQEAYIKRGGCNSFKTDHLSCNPLSIWTEEDIWSSYQSKQVEIARLTAEDGVGIQELKLTDLSRPTTINGQRIELPLLAQNDGLSFNDWFNWFIGYDLSKPLAIIHFTKFRY